MNIEKNKKPYCNVSTIGHIDHGKTTLTSAISIYLYNEGLKNKNLVTDTKQFKYEDIDSTKEERERGITINASHVRYETQDRIYAHVDCPGHADYIKNMIVGSSKIDGAILVVSALDGVMLQTTEHVILASRIGVKKLIVFINKMDMVKEEDTILVDLIEEEIKDLLNKYGYDSKNTPFVKGSAKLGTDNNQDKYGVPAIAELVKYMDSHIELPVIDSSLPFLMFVESVCSIQGRGTVATGRVDRGLIKKDIKVEILGCNDNIKNTTVTEVQEFHNAIEFAEQNQDIGLLLRGVDKKDVSRGFAIVAENTFQFYSKILCQFLALSKAEGGRASGFGINYAPQFFIKTLDVTGIIEEIKDVDMVLPGESAQIIVKFKKSIPIEKGFRFIVREGGRTIGAGIILDVYK